MVAGVVTVISRRAEEFIRRNGGRLFVWVGDPCCGGTRFVQASIHGPAGASAFASFGVGEIQLFVRPVHGRFPERLHVDVRGTRRPRAEAFWDGCGYAL